MLLVISVYLVDFCIICFNVFLMYSFLLVRFSLVICVLIYNFSFMHRKSGGGVLRSSTANLRGRGSSP